MRNGGEKRKAWASSSRWRSRCGAKRIHASDLSVGASSPDMHQTCVRKHVLRDSTSPRGGPKKRKIYSRTYRYLLNELKRPTGCGERITVFPGFSFGSLSASGNPENNRSLFIRHFSSFRREIGFDPCANFLQRFEKNFSINNQDLFLLGEFFFFFRESLFAKHHPPRCGTLHRKVTRSLECTYEFLKYPSSKRLHSQVSRKSRC